MADVNKKIGPNFCELALSSLEDKASSFHQAFLVLSRNLSRLINPLYNLALEVSVVLC